MLKELIGGGALSKMGYKSEIDYWKSLGGSGNTTVDCMMSYLGSQGYKGHPKDALRSWLQVTHNKGKSGDNARALAGV